MLLLTESRQHAKLAMTTSPSMDGEGRPGHTCVSKRISMQSHSLEQNYRSTNTTESANAVIALNQARREKNSGHNRARAKILSILRR